MELLLALMISSLLIFTAMTFYPQLQKSVLEIYQHYRLQETVEQAISGLIKDIKRSGFIANDLDVLTEPGLIINIKKKCIIIRYDADSTGTWRYFPLDSKNSDIFVYRYNTNNLEYRVGEPSCIGIGWGKLFDPSEVKVTQFSLNKRSGYIILSIAVQLKHHSNISYKLTQLIGIANERPL